MIVAGTDIVQIPLIEHPGLKTVPIRRLREAEVFFGG